MLGAAQIAVICITCGIFLGIVLCLCIFFLVQRGFFDVSRNTGASAEELECNGIPLDSRVPKLSPEEKKMRELMLAKYKRRLARQERRKEHEARRLARLQAGAEAEGDGATSSLSASTAPTYVSSTQAYGRANYTGMDEGLHGDWGFIHATMGARSDSRGVYTRTHSAATLRSIFSSGNSQRNGGGKRRTDRRRRRRAAAEAAEPSDALLQQWADLSDASSTSTTTTSDSSVEEIERHGVRPHRVAGNALHRPHTGGALSEPDDDIVSVASSLPRAPQDVLPPELLLGMDPAGASMPEFPWLLTPLATRFGSVPPSPLPTLSLQTTPLLTPEYGGAEPSALALAEAEHSLPGFHATHTATNRAPHRVPAAAESTTSRVVASDEPQLREQLGVPGLTATNPHKKKWTREIVRENLAMSGFFATAPPSAGHSAAEAAPTPAKTE